VQHPIEQQCQEADQGMRPDSVRQAMEDRRDLDLGLQNREPPFNIGQRLVARRDLGLKGTKPSALLSGEGFVFWGAWR